MFFAVALVQRLLFWRATPDSTWPHTAYFKGDALVWLEYAQALRTGQAFELGLPIHPPGAGYLLALLWDGSDSGLIFLRFAWAVMGALIVTALYVAAARSFPPRAAVTAGVVGMASTGLLLLSTSLSSETPYLLLVTASFSLFEDIRRRPVGPALAFWSALQGAASLFKVEHALFFALTLPFLVVLWRRDGRAPAGGLARRSRAISAVALSRRLRATARAMASPRLEGHPSLQHRTAAGAGGGRGRKRGTRALRDPVGGASAPPSRASARFRSAVRVRLCGRHRGA